MISLSDVSSALEKNLDKRRQAIPIRTDEDFYLEKENKKRLFYIFGFKQKKQISLIFSPKSNETDDQIESNGMRSGIANEVLLSFFKFEGELLGIRMS